MHSSSRHQRKPKSTLCSPLPKDGQSTLVREPLKGRVLKRVRGARAHECPRYSLYARGRRAQDSTDLRRRPSWISTGSFQPQCPLLLGTNLSFAGSLILEDARHPGRPPPGRLRHPALPGWHGPKTTTCLTTHDAAQCVLMGSSRAFFTDACKAIASLSKMLERAVQA